jgi:hypothetical protein
MEQQWCLLCTTDSCRYCLQARLAPASASTPSRAVMCSNLMLRINMHHLIGNRAVFCFSCRRYCWCCCLAGQQPPARA